MQIFETRYKARKERKSNSFMNSTDKIVKVSGGYTIMSIEEYRIWKNQK